MRRKIVAPLAGAILTLLLSGCDSSGVSEGPIPVEMTEDAVGHYCQMYVLDHEGPKAQIHLKGLEQPLWFAQVSEAIAYLNDEERSAEILAVFANDMGKAKSWAEPGTENWLNLETAYLVINSRQMGGMGTPEAIPFAARQAAEDYAARMGGEVVALTDVPEAYGRAVDMMNMQDAPGNDPRQHGG